jgi:hypothetical protein
MLLTKGITAVLASERSGFAANRASYACHVIEKGGFIFKAFSVILKNKIK